MARCNRTVVLNAASTALHYSGPRKTMIDNIALSIGHGLLAIALLRLVMRDGLDVDPLLDGFKQRRLAQRKAKQEAARKARRITPAQDAAEAD